MPRHHCHALGCNAACPPAYLMCGRHWRHVPQALQREVYRTVKQRDPQVIDASWAPWWRAQYEAIAHVATHERVHQQLIDRYSERELEFIEDLESKGKDLPMFNIVKTLKKSHCAARRCLMQQTVTAGESLDTHCELTDVLWPASTEWPQGLEVELCPKHYKLFLEGQLPGTVAPGPSEPSVPITITTEGEPAPLSVNERPVTFSFVPEKVLVEVRPIQEKAVTDLAQLVGFVIQTNAHSSLIQQMLIVTKREIKDLDSQRLSATKPLNDVKRVIDGWFKPAKDHLLAFEARLKGLVLTYTDAVAAAKIKALTEGRHEEALAAPDPELASGITRREAWCYDVIDQGQVPAQYWILNDKMIRDQIAREKGACTIPGIRIWDKGALAVKS